MRVETAQLSGSDTNADRVFVADQAVIMLDGASAFEPVDVDPATYTDLLGHVIADQLDQDQDAELAAAVAHAIGHAAAHLGLTAGHSPSSTVSVLRTRGEMVDFYVLGDSPIYYGTGRTTHRVYDARLSSVAEPEHHRYVSQLRAGRGYNAEHRAALVTLQRAQRRQRNLDARYWIAEAEPRAARHGITTSQPASAVDWAVLPTDGASDFIDHTDRSWAEIGGYDAGQLADLLARIHQWESATDPDGQHLPRAKRHDDKTVAVVRDIP
ncbi:MAG: protein phosphatase 2C domain-containing protein [Pseudonocardia sp.]|nr:protein phosphatase 2C domain-containing protein [Pseudonocardia sp.]